MIEPDHFDEKLAGGGSGPTICSATGTGLTHPHRPIRIVYAFNRCLPETEDILICGESIRKCHGIGGPDFLFRFESDLLGRGPALRNTYWVIKPYRASRFGVIIPHDD